MAKDILVTERLTDSMIKAGAELVARLDKNNAEVKSAFWFYISEDQVWKFIVASPQVDTIGPREYYKKINEANLLAENKEKVISLNDIGVSNTKNQIVQMLKFAICTGDGISGIRFSRNTINGIFIEDAYIYRSNS